MKTNFKASVKAKYPKAYAERQKANAGKTYWLIRPAVHEMYIATGKTEAEAWKKAKQYCDEALPPFTQGEWQLTVNPISNNPAIMSGKKCIAEMPDWRGDSFDPLTSEEEEANSHLLNASKDLYKALKNALKIVNASPVQFPHIVTEINKAVAKAEGK